MLGCYVLDSFSYFPLLLKCTISISSVSFPHTTAIFPDPHFLFLFLYVSYCSPLPPPSLPSLPLLLYPASPSLHSPPSPLPSLPFPSTLPPPPPPSLPIVPPLSTLLLYPPSPSTHLLYPLQFDADGNGHITASEISNLMKALGENVPGYKIRDMIREVDLDENGTVEFNEFVDVRKSSSCSELCHCVHTVCVCVSLPSPFTMQSGLSYTGFHMD